MAKSGAWGGAWGKSWGGSWGYAESRDTRRPARLPLRAISDAHVFAIGGRAASYAHATTATGAWWQQHTARARCSGRVSTTRYGAVGSVGRAKNPLSGGRVASFSTRVDALGVSTAMARPSPASVTNTEWVKYSTANNAVAGGVFSTTDAHFCRARGEQRMTRSYVAVVAARAARNTVDTRLR